MKCIIIDSFNEWGNINLVKLLYRVMDQKSVNTAGTSEKLITYVEDKPGHDLRYEIDALNK